METSEFSKIVTANQKNLYHFVRRMLISHEETNDVVQNVFIKAWTKIDSFRGNSKISTWLIRIAYNESINFIKAKKKRFTVSIDANEHLLPRLLENEKNYSGSEIQKILQQAITALPEKQKAVFIMKYYNEMQYSEIQSVTGTSVGALKASYYHAVKKIELFLNKH